MPNATLPEFKLAISPIRSTIPSRVPFAVACASLVSMEEFLLYIPPRSPETSSSSHYQRKSSRRAPSRSSTHSTTSECESCPCSVGLVACLRRPGYLLTARAGPLPAIFGLNIATYILSDMADKPISNPLPIKNRKKLYERMYRDLLHREQKLAGEQFKSVPSQSSQCI